MMLKIARDLSTPVRLLGIQPVMVFAAMIVHECFADRGLVCYVTSCTDGRHEVGSLHHAGLALDFRMRHVPEHAREALIEEIDDSIGPEFDVVFHADTPSLHVEYDPK